MFKNARFNNLLANLCLQLSGFVVVFTTPLLLNVEDFALSVYISTAVFLIGITDFGITPTYTRNFVRQSYQDINSPCAPDVTLLYFRLIASFLLVIPLTFWLFAKTESIFISISFVILSVVTVLGGYTQATINVRGAYKDLVKFNIQISLVKVILILCIFYCGIKGWVLLQCGYLLAILFNREARDFLIDSFKTWRLVSFKYITGCFPEAIYLGLSGIFFLQISNSSRIFASVFYNGSELSKYGIIIAFQSLVFGLASAYAFPNTMKIYAHANNQEANPFASFKVILLDTLVFIGFFVITIPLLQCVVNMLYNHYQIETGLLAISFLQFLYFPILLVYSPMLVANGMSRLLLPCAFFSLIVCFFAYDIYIDGSNLYDASILQLLAVGTYSLAVLVTGCRFLGNVQNHLYPFMLYISISIIMVVTCFYFRIE